MNGNVWKCDSRREKYKQGPRKIGKSKLPPIKSISAASRFSLFLDHEGNVWSQGRSKQGCLGFEDTLFQRCPTKIPNLCNIVEISSSDNCSMFLDGDGTVWACGDDHYYVYVNLQSNRPCKIKGLPPIRAISVGYRHWLFLDEKGRVWGLGLNKFRVFGSVRNSHDKRVVYIQKPILVTGLGEIVAIEAGTHASLYIDSMGCVWATGSNFCSKLKEILIENKPPRYMSIRKPAKLDYPQILIQQSPNLKSARNAY